MEHVEHIRLLNERYFHCLDGADPEGLASCFATDAVASYLDGAWRLRGRQAITDKLRIVDTFASTTHIPGAIRTHVDGGQATGTVWAVAYLCTVATTSSPARVIVRGLCYEDAYVLQSGAWWIGRREQVVLWQFDTPATSPSLPTLSI